MIKSEFSGKTCVLYYHGDDSCTKWNLGDSTLNIEPDGDNGEDFVLTDEHAWIRVGNLSVRINDCGNFMKVGVWELGDEFNDPIDQIKVYQPVEGQPSVKDL